MGTIEDVQYLVLLTEVGSGVQYVASQRDQFDILANNPLMRPYDAITIPLVFYSVPKSDSYTDRFERPSVPSGPHSTVRLI